VLEVRKTATINFRISADLKKELDKCKIDLSKWLRQKLIFDLVSTNSEVKAQAELELQIERTSVIMRILNATKIIYQKMNNPRQMRILAREVLKTLEMQKEATNDEHIKKICEAEIKDIQNKMGAPATLKENKLRMDARK